MELFLTTWASAIPVYMTPLLLASIGLILCERAGILNLGSEGLMGFGAMAGAVAVLSGYSSWSGLAIGAVSGLIIGIPFAIAVVVLRANHILAGLAVVAAGLGLAATIGRDYVHKPFKGVAPIDFGPLAEIPYIGGFLFRQEPMVYGAVVLALALSWILARTKFGLRLRAVGEDPATADASGVDVQLYQILAVIAGTILISLAGAYLSVISSKVYVDGMVAGRGWIAIALVVFAQWSPGRAIGGALLFATADSLIPRLQALGVEVPVYILSMMPYALTIVILVVVVVTRPDRQGEPGHLGRDFIRQDR